MQGFPALLHAHLETAQSAGSRHLDGANLSIGEVVRRFDVTRRSLHFYEQRGMLTTIRKSGARYYDETQLERLKAILKGKSLGFTLTEIESLLQDSAGQDMDGGLMLKDRKVIRSQLKYLTQRRDEIERAIAELTASLDEAAKA